MKICFLYKPLLCFSIMSQMSYGSLTASAPPVDEVAALRKQVSDLQSQMKNNKQYIDGYRNCCRCVSNTVLFGCIAVFYLFSAVVTFIWAARSEECVMEHHGINYKKNLVASTAFKLIGMLAIFAWMCQTHDTGPEDTESQRYSEEQDNACCIGLAQFLMIISVIGISVCMLLDGVLMYHLK